MLSTALCFSISLFFYFLSFRLLSVPGRFEPAVAAQERVEQLTVRAEPEFDAVPGVQRAAEPPRPR